MNNSDEHDDDLEPEVMEGAEIETEEYLEDDETEQHPHAGDVTDSIGRADEETSSTVDVDEEEREGDGTDTI